MVDIQTLASEPPALAAIAAAVRGCLAPDRTCQISTRCLVRLMPSGQGIPFKAIILSFIVSIVFIIGGAGSKVKGLTAAPPNEPQLFEEEHQKEQEDSHERNEAAGSDFDIEGADEAQEHGQQAEAYGKEQGRTEAFFQLQGSGDRQGDHGTEHEDTDDLDRDGYGSSHEDGEDVIDDAGMHAGELGGLFVISDIEQLMIEEDERQDGGDGKGQDADDIALVDGQDAAEKESIGIGMELAGADERDGRAGAERQDDSQDEIEMMREIAAQEFDQGPAERSEAESAEDRVLPAEQSKRDAGQGSMGHGIADHGTAAQDDEDADAGAEQGNAAGYQQGILHEII